MNALKALLVDAGNTRIQVAGWRGGGQHPRLTRQVCDPGQGTPTPLDRVLGLATPPAAEAEQLLAALTAVQAEHPDLPVVLTAVVPHVADLIRSVWDDVLVVGHLSPLPFRLSLPDPAAIGPDRLCNMAAAAAAGFDSALVVDAGTATTFDLLLRGEFVGGLIAPGMALGSACLAERTARLSSVPFVPCPLVPGRDTAAAMQAGAFHVGVGGVETVIEDLCRQNEPLPVVVTGGLGRYLAAADRVWDVDWTLRGAAVLAGLD